MAISQLPWRKRVGTFFLGTLFNWLFDQAFNNVLYPLVLGTQGFVHGSHIMIWASTLTCLLFLKFYDWSGQDWLGIETLKEVREFENSGANRFIARFLKKSQWAQLVILSIARDPFIVTVFLRDGAHTYGVMKRKDWNNFFLSVVVGNVYWAIVCWSGIKILEAIGLKLGWAITILCATLIFVVLVGFIIGKINEKREKKKVE